MADKPYKKLLVLESDENDSEDEEAGDVDDVHCNTNSGESVTGNGRTTKSSKPANKDHALTILRNRYERQRACRCCSPAACALSFALILLALGLGYMAGFLTSGLGAYDTLMNIFQAESSSPMVTPWRTKFSDYGSESCIRLVDVDGDGLDDVVIGLAFGRDVTAMIVESTMDKYCQEEGMQTPCAGAVVALRGYDGKLLWKVTTYAEIFEINCNLVDSNSDGIKECVASGRLGTIYSIDVRTGQVIWEGDPQVMNRGWNIYSATRLPDFDGDGVTDIVIAHGGDPTVAAEIRQRNGWNNNPTAQQFRASVRTLMIQNDVKASEYANCLQLDGTEELQLDCFLLKAPAKPQNLPDFSQDDMFAAAVDRLESTFTLLDNEWRYSCLTYTARFVCARLIPKIKCSDCRAALTCAETPEDIRFSFLRRRDQGGLVCPSDGVVQLLLATEKAFRVVMPSPDVMQTLPHKKFIDVQIQNLVLTYVKEKYFDLFPSLRDHFYDHEMIVEEDHITSLIKSVASYYLRMRLFKAGKLHQQRMILGGKAAKRMKLNKLVGYCLVDSSFFVCCSSSPSWNT